MTKQRYLEDIAPCGLVCRTCIAGKGSIIEEHAQGLSRFLDGFDDLAKRIAGFDKTYEKYPDFRGILDKFASPSCGGCRTGKGIHAKCIIPQCIKEKGIDFCAECDDFPCERTGFIPELLAKWKKHSTELRDLGTEEYHRRELEKSHYR